MSKNESIREQVWTMEYACTVHTDRLSMCIIRPKNNSVKHIRTLYKRVQNNRDKMGSREEKIFGSPVEIGLSCVICYLACMQ